MNSLPTILVINATLAAVLALAAMAVGAMRKPGASHAAWLLVMVKFLTPPLVVVPIVVATTTPDIVETTVQQESKIHRELPTPEELPPPLITAPEETVVLPMAEPIAIADVPLENVMPKVVDEPTPEPTRAVTSVYTPPTWQTVALGVWALGVLVFGLLLVRHIKAGINLARLASPADGLTSAQLQKVAKRLGLRRIPQIQMIPAAISPLVWSAWWKPRIWLPATLWQTLSYEQRETILAHECAHLVNADHWVRRFEIVVLAIYWWCPVAWFTARKLREYEETRADDRVLSTYPTLAPAYAQALVDTVAFVVAPRWAPLASPSTTTKSSLERRLTMILSQSPKTRAWPAAVAVALGVITLPFSPGFAQAPPAREEVPVPTQNAPQPPIRYGSYVEVFPAAEGGQSPIGGPPAAKAVKPTTPNAMEPPVKTYVEYAGKSQRISELKDQLELLEAALDVKRAYVTAAERNSKSTLEKMDLMAKDQFGSVLDLQAAKTAHNTALSESDIKMAELKEHMVKIAQVKRKLKEAEASQPNPTWPPKTTPPSVTPNRGAASDYPKPDTTQPATAPRIANTVGSTGAGMSGGMSGAGAFAPGGMPAGGTPNPGGMGMPAAVARSPLGVAGGPGTPPPGHEPEINRYSTALPPGVGGYPGVAPAVAMREESIAKYESAQKNYEANIVKLKKQIDELTKERDELRVRMQEIEKLREDFEKLKKNKKE